MSHKIKYPRCNFRRLRNVFLTMLVALAALAPSTPSQDSPGAIARAQDDGPTSPVVHNPTPTEKLVMDTLAKGDRADFPHQSDLILRSEVLAKLLHSDEKHNPNGIRIKKARVRGRLDVSIRDIVLSFTCESCEFDDPVDFSSSHFMNDVTLTGSRFAQGLILEGARFDRSLNLTSTRIHNNLDFSFMQVSGALFADGLRARDLPIDVGAQFDNVRVGAAAQLTNTRIVGDLLLEGADVGELHLGVDPGPKPCPLGPDEPSLGKNVSLRGLTVRHDVFIGCTAVDSFTAANMQVLGRTTIRGLTVRDYADFKGARLQYLVLIKPNLWPASDPRKLQPALELDGIGFSQIDVQDADQREAVDSDWRDLLGGWLGKASFSSQPYHELESAFRSAGRSDLADETYEKMKDHERASHRLGWLDWLKSFLLSFLIRYGREPYRVIYIGFSIVVLGWYLFRDREFMDPKKPQYEKRPYSPFWYSLLLFLPLSNVPDCDAWEPKDNRPGLQIYARVHSLLGWILVPIGLAAVSGLISTK